MTSSDVFSYSSVSSVGEVNFNYIFSGPFARLGSSSSSKDLCWIFFPFQAQGFLVCLLSWCFYPESQEKHFCLLVFFPTALILIVDICWAFTTAFYWIMPDYYNSFCHWVTFWLLPGQRFPGRFSFLPKGHSFMGSSSLTFFFPELEKWSEAPKVLSLCAVRSYQYYH